MSIASEITDLQTNLTSAKSAVTTKGGTVGDTGLAGLASEIATIPSGGSLDNYGSIKYLDGSDVEHTLTLATEEDFLALTEASIPGSNIEVGGVTMNSAKITEVTVADGVQYLPSGFLQNCYGVTSVILPSTIHFIGRSAFYGCRFTSALNLENVRFIDTSFMQNNTYFNSSISLPNVEFVGDAFMRGCSSFNSSLTLNTNTVRIGQNFLYDCTSFAQSFTMPAGVKPEGGIEAVGGFFMYNCKNFVGPLVCSTPNAPSGSSTLGTNDATAPMYATGVTLTGTYASTWKTALPDRDSSPYRKLIVGS